MTLSAAVFALCLRLQDAKAAAPPVDEAAVDAAIKKGVACLRTAPSPGAHAGIKDSDELILWTFVHAGVRESDPDFQKYFKKMLEGTLEKTYKVALQAMILEEIDRAKYQERIAQCAQFLVDNQCLNGQWSYGTPTAFADSVKVPENKSVATPAPAAVPGGTRDFGAAEQKQKPKVLQKVPVKKQKDGPAAGDNSNTQYAALGLRACHDAGIVIQDTVLVLAVKWWRESQQGEVDKDGKAVATGGAEKSEGWNYKDKASQPDKAPYSAMTAGGTSSLILYDYILGRRWKEDVHVKQGMAWLAQHWAINRNYYYLYGLERTGILFGADKFGDHYWYSEGAKFLLKDQNADGSWGHRTKPEEKDRATQDTCFAILFLKKATRPLVASEDRK
ncbi:MAG: hypothetical protein HY293_20715 [Planctomycetes bacterium]|nr:hypothetical protein [Planctomycetota bacterium]